MTLSAAEPGSGAIITCFILEQLLPSTVLIIASFALFAVYLSLMHFHILLYCLNLLSRLYEFLLLEPSVLELASVSLSSMAPYGSYTAAILGSPLALT